jgi:hypothetical protein
MTETTTPKDNKPRDLKDLVRPGDVLIHKVEMTTLSNETLDLKPFVVEINVFEDMFSPSLTGNIVIRDSLNLIGQLPLVGDEVVTLDIVTPGFAEPDAKDAINKIQKSFSVYAIKNRQLNADREQFYTIHFCSMEASLDNVAKVSRKFEGSTDEIALQVYEEFFQIPRIFSSKTSMDSPEGDKSENPNTTSEDTNKKYTPLFISDTPHTSRIAFVSPMWSPMKILNWLAKRSLGSKHDSPTFLFYETTKAFYFASIEALIDVQMTNNLIYSDFIYNTQLNDTRQSNSLSQGYATVKDMKFLSQLDVLKSQDLGHFVNSVYTFDLIKKEHKHWVYDHGFQFDEYKHLETYKYAPGKENKYIEDETKKYHSLFPINVMRSYNTKNFLATVNPGVLDSTQTSVDLAPEDFIGQRNSALMDMSTMKISIDVPGRTDCEAGKIVRFFYPSVTPKSEDTAETSRVLWDPLVSGFFMITAIHHHITPFHHNMILELSKDSYANALLDITETETTGEDAGSKPQTSSPTNTQDPNATPPTNKPVGKGSFIGDSIAVGLGGSAKDATTNATVGWNTDKIKQNYSSKGGSDYTVISMGSNDKGYPNAKTTDNATALRESIKAQSKKVVWILPYDRTLAQKIQSVASKYGDKTVDLKEFPSGDGLHPKSYPAVLKRVNQIVAS